MLEGYARRSIEHRNALEIVIADSKREIAWTFEFRRHDGIPEHVVSPVTRIMPDAEPLIHALAQALQQAGILPESAVTTELKATKYHLEDMRKLVPRSGGSLEDSRS